MRLSLRVRLLADPAISLVSPRFHPLSQPPPHTPPPPLLPNFPPQTTRELEAPHAMAPDIPTQVLHALNDAPKLPLLSTAAFPGTESTTLKGALDSLQSRDMVAYETVEKEVAVLTEEGAGIVQDGSHEAKVYEAVCRAMDGLKITELAVSRKTARLRCRERG